MEQLSQEQLGELLSKEWLVKIDSENSIPYLFKFNSSTADSTCLIMITDTKSVWVEVRVALNSSQIARRWRTCNVIDTFIPSSAEEEDSEKAWRSSIVDNLSKIHTPGGMNIVSSFQVIESNFSDFALEIEFEEFKWAWETHFTGHRNSAEIISKHLVLPLISFSHISFISGSPGQMTESELEKMIDTTARNARRSIDTHMKNVVSKPLITTSIRRLTAMLNFSNKLQPILSTAEAPELTIPPFPHPKVRATTPSKPHDISRNRTRRESSPVETPPKRAPSPSSRENSPKPIAAIDDDDSATESSDAEPEPDGPAKPTLSELVTSAPIHSNPPKSFNSKSPGLQTTSGSDVDSSSSGRSRKKVEESYTSDDEKSGHLRSRNRPLVAREYQIQICYPLDRLRRKAQRYPLKAAVSDPDSSPARPVAKKKKVESSSEDSEEERRKRVAKLKSGGAGARGSVRQPLKRGGKRF
ncbi:hypothetical protein D9757_008041 [Collybiopsis confluens]|uniref:XLF-like N-terminal domain-containing protein n=1 Tax=Collybiopsis confluens TaxID=2823264 RepID=A0A8H5H5Y7_9AGAR|nr:hypothetical protein D9757_008041 [Collybiopsis confluens]